MVAVQFALVDQTGAHPKAVLERVIARRLDPPCASPDALVRGYGDAFAEILGELSTDLQVVAEESAPPLPRDASGSHRLPAAEPGARQPRHPGFRRAGARELALRFGQFPEELRTPKPRERLSIPFKIWSR